MWNGCVIDMTEGVKIAIVLNTGFRKHSMENTPTFPLGDFHIVNRICFIPRNLHGITAGYCPACFYLTVMPRNTLVIYKIFFCFSMRSLRQKNIAFLDETEVNTEFPAYRLPDF